MCINTTFTGLTPAGWWQRSHQLGTTFFGDKVEPGRSRVMGFGSLDGAAAQWLLSFSYNQTLISD
jgi:hypothetical protein